MFIHIARQRSASTSMQFKVPYSSIFKAEVTREPSVSEVQPQTHDARPASKHTLLQRTPLQKNWTVRSCKHFSYFIIILMNTEGDPIKENAQYWQWILLLPAGPPNHYATRTMVFWLNYGWCLPEESLLFKALLLYFTTDFCCHFRLNGRTFFDYTISCIQTKNI